MSTSFQRFVALGDSTTEGMNDPDGSGGYRGWADRLATRLADLDPAVAYANLAVRGRTSAQVLEDQLAPAVAMQPDLASVEVGLNDVLRPRFDVDLVAARIERMVVALLEAGAVTLVFTLPDPSPFMPLVKPLRGRLRALNAAVLRLAASTGAAVVDLGAHPVVSDPRFWSEDRLHGNPLGHRRIEEAAAAALGMAGADDSWTTSLPPLPARTLRERVGAEVGWARRHLAPWVTRHARGRSSGDGRAPKRPQLAPVRCPAPLRAVGADGA